MQDTRPRTQKTNHDFEANGAGASNGQQNGPAATTADPYNLESLRLSQDFVSAVGGKKLTTTIPVKKPLKEWFVRTHPDPDFWLQTAVVELKEKQGEVYLVAPTLWPELSTEATFSPRLFATSISRQGVLFLWPMRLPGSDGRADEWNKSAMIAADEAKSHWVRVVANMSLGAYDITVAPARLPEPVWPDLPFQQIIKIAFRDRLIEDLDHPILKRLRGEA